MSEVFWAIIYEDSEKNPNIFTDEDTAKKYFERTKDNWNCYLFKQIKNGSEMCEGPKKSTKEIVNSLYDDLLELQNEYEFDEGMSIISDNFFKFKESVWDLLEEIED